MSHNGSHPTHFTLQRLDAAIAAIVEKDIEALKVEEAEEVIYSEGKRSVRLVKEYERNPELRTAAVRAHGTRCQVCGFSFAEVYGEHGKDFIEIHHLNPVAQYTGEVTVDPVREMAALCANCHRMIHRRPDKILSVEELRQIVQAHRLNR
jgi:predicted HNH restriction endonuclease